MTLRSGFFNSEAADRLYSAEDFSIYLEGIIANGCFPNDSGFLVTANPESMGQNPPSVLISPGKAYFDGRWFANDIEYVYTMGITQIVIPNQFHLLYFCFNTVARTVTIDHICASNPVVPADNAGLYYMPLAMIADHQTVQPEQSDITDMRWMAGVSAISVDTPSLVNGAVTYPKIGTGAVHALNIYENAVQTAAIDEYAVGTDELALLAVTRTRLAVAAADYTKLGNQRLGRTSFINVGSRALSPAGFVDLQGSLTITPTENCYILVIANILTDSAIPETNGAIVYHRVLAGSINIAESHSHIVAGSSSLYGKATAVAVIVGTKNTAVTFNVSAFASVDNVYATGGTIEAFALGRDI